MTSTQTQTTLAPIIAFLAGLLAGKGVFGFDAATWTLIIGGAAGLAATIWGGIITRKKSLVSEVNGMPEVAGVVTVNSSAGNALAASIPSNTVAPAGSNSAVQMAQNGTK